MNKNADIGLHRSPNYVRLCVHDVMYFNEEVIVKNEKRWRTKHCRQLPLEPVKENK